ncbi:hypothetical protein [Hydrogenophaga sp. PAMC20947]|uniref:hypothetical protein n=1 Tax=Hydrogenophaga sp. PAMC20947 TaxID=2565558 RepID=UPI001446115D|nr:hypothetical protein [Hydrogenophaga sp. PAMC20947]
MQNETSCAGRTLLIAALCSGAALTAQAATCPLPADAPALMVSGPVQASWTTEPALPTVGEPFVMRLTLCPVSAQLMKVDAEMPDHRHGMNYKPSFTALDDGQWRVEGMVWHMAGRWALKVDTRLDGQTHTLTRSVILK